MNHAVHMAAVTQIRFQGSEGRAYYDKKITEGKTSKEALRALKRQVSDALYKRMKAGARRAAASVTGPGGHPGNNSVGGSGARAASRTVTLRDCVAGDAHGTAPNRPQIIQPNGCVPASSCCPTGPGSPSMSLSPTCGHRTPHHSSCPERLEVSAGLPRTAGGKLSKVTAVRGGQRSAAG
jgi:hypothetical protein